MSGGAQFVRGDAGVLPFPAASFDAVYDCSILHHLDVELALTEVRRVLRPGGCLVFSEPNLLNPQVFLMFNLHPLRPWSGFSPDEMAFTRRAITRVLHRLQFHRVRVRYFDFLHPAIPAGLVPVLEPVLEGLEPIDDDERLRASGCGDAPACDPETSEPAAKATIKNW